MKFKNFPKALFYLHKNPFLNSMVSRNGYFFRDFQNVFSLFFKKIKKTKFLYLYEKKSGK